MRSLTATKTTQLMTMAAEVVVAAEVEVVAEMTAIEKDIGTSLVCFVSVPRALCFSRPLRPLPSCLLTYCFLSVLLGLFVTSGLRTGATMATSTLQWAKTHAEC